MVSPETFWASTLTTAVVEVFDGSGIDPVVVSNVFWSKLQANFISILIGQFLAAIAFAFITSLAASQLTKLGSHVTDNFVSNRKDLSAGRVSTVFQRA
jgi:cadmium resistance protein CadD (predicted permease)